MKNEQLWKQYADYTDAVSSNARKLAFGAAGLCWILRTENGVFPVLAIFALVFIIAFFVDLNVCQCFASTIDQVATATQEVTCGSPIAWVGVTDGEVASS